MVDLHDVELLVQSIADPLPDEYSNSTIEVAVNTAFVTISISNLPHIFDEADADIIYTEISERIDESIAEIQSNGFYRIDSETSMRIIFTHNYCML